MLKAGSIIFLAAVVCGAAMNNAWLRAERTDLRAEVDALRIADTASKATIEKLQAQVHIVEAVIAERNRQVSEARKRADAATAELERLQNENQNVAAWSRDAVPGDVLRLLQDGICPAGRNGNASAAGGADDAR